MDEGHGARRGGGEGERHLALVMAADLVVSGPGQTGGVLPAEVGEEVGGVDEDGGEIDRVAVE
jgi:hypothetical protein